MSDFIGNCWILLVNTYQTVYSGGYVGCFVALALGVILANKGGKITGRGESFTGTVSNGFANLSRNPAVEGTAKSWVGRICGTLLQLAGTMLIIITILAFVNILMFGEPRR